MTLQMLLCPGCRARVLENWAECKFCGEALTSDPIRATVHPDDLTAPPAAAAPSFGAPLPEPPDAAPSGTGLHDWSQWVNDPAAPEVSDAPPPPARASDDFDYPVPPEPPDWDAVTAADSPVAADASPTLPKRGGSSWDEAPQEQVGLHAVAPTPEPPMAGSAGPSDAATAAGWGAPATPHLPPPPAQVPSDPWREGEGESPGAALEPVQGASGQWATGPAPIVSGANDDLGPSGLDPVSWYTEPSADAGSTSTPESADPSPASPSLFGDRSGGAEAVAGVAAAGSAGAPFDANAIFRGDPELADAGALQRQKPAGEVAVQWQPAADAWNAAAEPEGAPKGQPVLSREVRLLAFGILALVVIGLLANAALDRRNSYPANWTPDVQGVAAWVSHKRGLPFKHALPVRTVDANEYANELAVARSAPNVKDKQALVDQVAALRALGAVEGNPTISIAPALFTDANSGAFYDVRAGRLVLRAGSDASRLKVAVAGALSMALDDQYGDFSGLTSTSLTEEPLSAVVAGNAAVVRADYIAAQSPELRAKSTGNAPASRPLGSSFEASNAALEVGTGQGLVSLVRSVDSTDAVNQLSVVPPGSDLQVLDPTVYLAGQRPLVVNMPEISATAKTIDSGTIGASTWYLIIAQRLGSQQAFAAADAWSGDSFISYREANGQVCIADVLRASDETSAGALLDTMNAWRAKVPGDQIKVTQRAGDLVAVSACDPGEPAKQALTAGYDQVVKVAVARSTLSAFYYKKGTEVPNGPNGPILTPDQAWCMANRVVGQALPEELTDLADGKGARFKPLTLQAGSACGSNLVAQLVRTASGD